MQALSPKVACPSPNEQHVDGGAAEREPNEEGLVVRGHGERPDQIELIGVHLGRFVDDGVAALGGIERLRRPRRRRKLAEREGIPVVGVHHREARRELAGDNLAAEAIHQVAGWPLRGPVDQSILDRGHLKSRVE